MAQAAEADFPLQFSVDYPDRDLNRLTTALRIFTVIPIAIVLATISGGPDFSWAERDATYAGGLSAGGVLFLAPLLMIVFRQKYPRWWFDWNLNLVRFENRVFAYLFLLRDEYPSTDEEQAVRLDFPYPDARNDLNRWLPLVKWLLAIPHYIVLIFLVLAALVIIIIAWFAIPVYRTLPARAVRLRGGRNALGEPRAGLRLCFDYGPLSAFPAEPLTSAATKSH